MGIMKLVRWLMFLKCIYLYCIILAAKGTNGVRNETRMILDIIRFYDKPLAVMAKVCWRNTDKMKLAKTVMYSDEAKSIQFVEKFGSITKFTGEDTIIVLDLNCQDSGEFIEQGSKNNKFEKPYRWLLLSNSEEINIRIFLELRKISISIDSEVVIAYKSRNDGAILYRVYKIDATTDLIFETFGTWTVSNRLTVLEEAKTTTSVRRKNLGGKRIGVSIVSTEETTKKEIYNLNDVVTDNVSKISFHNIVPLYAYMNATPELLFTDTWGYYINNSWNGMIGQMLRGDADLCGTILLMRLDRSEVLSFMTQPIPITCRFVFREPPLSFQNNLFYLPFKSSVWMCFGALIVVIIVVVYLTARWEVEKIGAENDDAVILRPCVSDVAIFVAGAVLQQGSSNEMKGSLGRVVTFIVFMIFLFLYVSYSANIVALLQSTSDQIRTLTDLLNSKIELGVEDQPYTRYYFTTANDGVRKAIYNTKIARVGHKPNFMSIDEGVRRLQNVEVPFAFHMNTGLGYRLVDQYFYEHEKCGLREIEYIPNANPWISCRKYSPYREIYKIGLTRLWEHGIGDRINRLIFSRKPPCTTAGGSFASVNMTDFHPVLLWLLYGMIASVMLLGMEIYIFNRQNRLKARIGPKYNKSRNSITSQNRNVLIEQ